MTIGAGVGTVAVVVVGWLLPLLPLLLLGMSVDAAHSAAKLTRTAATVLRRTAAMIGRLAMPLSVVRGGSVQNLFRAAGTCRSQRVSHSGRGALS